MSNYKINRNKKPLDDQQIEKHKNFSKLMGDYQKLHHYHQATKPLYKNVKFMSLVVVIFTVVLIFVLEQYEQEDHNNIKREKEQIHIQKDSVSEKTDTSTSAVDETSTPSDNGNGNRIFNGRTESAIVNPSLPPNLKIPFTIKKVKASEGAVLYLQNGTRLIVPPSAFKDTHGRIIDDDVEIHYREFRNPADFFMGDITMHFSGSGENSVFLESAGMFEIRAYQNGEPVELNKELKAELITFRSKNDYAAYFFNETERKWEKNSTDKTERTFIMSAVVNNRNFNAVTAEAAVYAGIEWVLHESVKEGIYQALLRGEWYNLSIQDKNNDQMYEITMGNGTQTHSFQATLKQVKANPEHHRQWMIDKYKEYTTIRNKHIKLTEVERQRIQEYTSSPQYQEYLKWLNSPEGKKAMLNASVMTTFSISNFGLWNCDRPEGLPKGAMANAFFQDEKGNRFTPASVCLVDYNKNSVFTYYDNSFNKFSFNPESENMIWFVIDEKHIGIVEKDKFKNLAILSGSCIFPVKSVDVSGYTPAELRKLLNMSSHVSTTEQIKAQNQPGKPDKVVTIVPLMEVIPIQH